LRSSGSLGCDDARGARRCDDAIVVDVVIVVNRERERERERGLTTSVCVDVAQRCLVMTGRRHNTQLFKPKPTTTNQRERKRERESE
jgi:hypothetical protein